MKRYFLFLSALVCGVSAFAQKKPLDHTVYDGWQHIGERLISNDGRWAVYTIDPQEGDNQLVIQKTDGSYKKTIARGYNAVITEDGLYVVFKIKPFYKDTREARIKKKKADEMPKDSLAILELGKEDVWKKPMVKNYKTPAKSYGWVAYQLEKPVEQPGKKLPPVAPKNDKATDSLKKVIDSLTNVIQNFPQKKRKDGDDIEINDGREFYGTMADAEGDEPGAGGGDSGNDLVVRNIASGEELVFYKVLEYYFSKTGDKLLIEQAKNPADSNSVPQVLLYDLRSGRSIALSKGGNEFKNFAMTDDASQVAYLAERDAKPKELIKSYRIWYYREGQDSASLLLDRNTPGMKLGMTVSEYGNLSFSKSGKRLFFGMAPIQAPKDTSLVEFDYPKLDIWHYKDDYLQTVQNYPARLRAAQQENYLSVYELGTSSFRQLGSKEVPQVFPTNEGDGEIFVGVTDYGKRVESQWTGGTKKDIYAIQISTGEKGLIKSDLQGQVYPSATGKYVMWYDRKARHYFAWNGLGIRNISEKVKFPLWNEENDTPEEPNNYGVMGWHEGDSMVYVYDRYDLWALDPSGGKPPRNITVAGRSMKDIYRYLRLDDEERFVTSRQPLYFRVQNQQHKEAAIRMGRLADNAPIQFTLTGGKYSYGLISKARNAGRLIYTKENFVASPDLYSNDDALQVNGSHSSMTSVSHEVRLSAINPQQSDYTWGTAELFNWKAYNGKDASGILYKPDNFDAKKKYPMIIYFYEKLSDNLYDYKEPAPIRSAINIPFFVSRGYLIFTPDIEYKVGYPGQGAYDYIVSGARAIVKKGWADSTRIGIQGHSWGGYQAAQLATMTKLFKAVWAGAPVANMTSAYGGIRWESGVSRQFQYEKTQSRIGGTLWEKLPLYLENSPLFHLDKVTAPMVIMANDADGAVPWYQGIELFTAMRRLGKKVWMFNYNGQGHGLTQRQDMRDYQIRMQQFFDWQLKDEQPTKWITDGVPAVKKGKEWGLE